MNDVSIQEWWNKLSKPWQSLLLFNLHLNREYGFTDDARGILKIAVNPFANYEFKHGQPYSEPVITAEDIKQVGDLHFLYAAECELGDIQPLARLTHLTFVDLCFNNIRSLDALTGHRDIKWLYVQNNKLDSLAALKDAIAIEELIVRENRLTALDEIDGLQALQLLDVGSNQIEDIMPIEKLVALQELQCDMNAITDIGSVKALQALRIITLAGNPVKDLKVLLTLPALTYADLSYIEGLNDALVVSLKEKGVEVIYNK